MNWLLLVVAVIIIGNIWSGWRRGMIVIVLSFAALFVSIYLTAILTPTISESLEKNTKIYENLEQSTYDRLKDQGTVSGAIDSVGAENGINQAGDLSIGELGSQFDTFTEKVVERLQLPEQFRTQIQEAQIGSSISSGVTDTIHTVEDRVTQFVAEEISRMIFNGIIYVIVFAVIFALIQVVIRLANVIGRFPIIHELNKTGGILVGACKGVLVVWLLFVIMDFFYGTELVQNAYDCINQSAVLTFIYQNNLLARLFHAIFS